MFGKVVFVFFALFGYSFATSLLDLEKYLNSMQTMEAKFLQDDMVGKSISEGKMYISRPSKLRLDYTYPHEISLYANHGILTYYDKDLDEISNIPLKSTPLHFLLQDKISLKNRDITVHDLKDDGKEVHLSLQETANKEQGILTLTFAKMPLALKKIKVTSEGGHDVELDFYEMRINEKIKNSLFEFVSPRLRRKI